MTQSEIQELDRIRNNRSILPNSTYTTTKAVAKQLILDGMYFCRGEGRKHKAKHLGLGCYEVSSYLVS
jgi:hypothetical protein